MMIGTIAILVVANVMFVHWRPEYAQLSPAERQWFYNQQVPGGPSKGTRCCSISDGTYAQEDIRDGHYWVNFHYRPDQGGFDDGGTPVEMESGWMEVPDEAVIH